MHYIRFDSVGGASGDMILAALAGMGADLSQIFATLAARLPEPLSAIVKPASSHGLNGLRVRLSSEPQTPGTWPDAQTHEHKHAHDHSHGHEHAHDHAHGHKHDHAHHAGNDSPPATPSGHHHTHDHHHRTLAEITPLLAGDTLALSVFRRLAEAEGHIHGKAPDAVHFHEVGALDSIADIAGACLALRQLGVGGVTVGPLPCGIGTITCAHGIMPNPAPATLELLQGMETIQTDEPFELVTPTAAALFAVWTRDLPPPPTRLRVLRSAFGFGNRTLANRPNVLRATLFEEADVETATPDADLVVLEANLDDCNPQWIGDLIARALKAGALDAWAVPATFKKARPGVVFAVLVPQERVTAVEALIFAATTTFGIRRHAVDRSILDRRFETAVTPWGEVRIKIGARDGRDLVRTPEYEDCARVADAAGVTPRQVYEAALAASLPSRSA